MKLVKWHKFKDLKPANGDYIAMVRKRYPAFYWIGFYDDKPCEEEDEPDYWLKLPELPKE